MKVELFLAWVVACGLYSCGEQADEDQPGTSGGDGGTGSVDASGGSATSSGGASGGTAASDDLQSLADLSDECKGQGVCDSTIVGTWTVDDRCDRSGTETLEACSEVEASWQVTRLGGRVTFDSYEFTWNQSTELEWSFDVSDLCGVSCSEFPTQLAERWSFLECGSSGGGCSCSGVELQTVDLEGYYTVGAEGVTLTPFDAISDPDRPRYNVAVCAETAALTMYSDELGNLVVRKE